MKIDSFNQIIKRWPPNRVFIDLLGKYLGMNVGLLSSEGVCLILKTFYDNFVDVCERNSGLNCSYYK